MIQFLSAMQASTQRQSELWCWSNSSFALLALLFMTFLEIRVFKMIDWCPDLYLDWLLNMIFLCYLVAILTHIPAIVITILYWQGDSTSWIWTYGMAQGHIHKEYGHSHIQYSWQPYTPHTSAQNGKYECLHTIIMNHMQAICSDSKLPQKLWGEAVKVMSYLKNCMPTMTLADKSPFGMWYGQHPDVSCVSLGVRSGCISLVRTPNYTTNLSSASRLATLIT